jgi:hypothetical protein
MRTAISLTTLIAALVLAVPASLAQPSGAAFVTDTLGGNGHPPQNQGSRFITDTLAPGGSTSVQRYWFITDTLAPGGNKPQQTQGYRFITDTLAPGGGPAASVIAPTSAGGFQWADAGIGAASAVSLCLLAFAALIGIRRQRSLAL